MSKAPKEICQSINNLKTNIERLVGNIESALDEEAERTHQPPDTYPRAIEWANVAAQLEEVKHKLGNLANAWAQFEPRRVSDHARKIEARKLMDTKTGGVLAGIKEPLDALADFMKGWSQKASSTSNGNIPEEFTGRAAWGKKRPPTIEELSIKAQVIMGQRNKLECEVNRGR